MKIIFTILLACSIQFTLGQIQLGRYSNIKDTTLPKNSFEEVLSKGYYSSLLIKPDQTFIYDCYPSVSCLLWYHIKGVWNVKNNYLILTDSSRQYHCLNVNLTQKAPSVIIQRKNSKPLKNTSVSYKLNNSKEIFSGFTTHNGTLALDSSLQKAKAADIYILKPHKKYIITDEPEFQWLMTANTENYILVRTTIYKIEKNQLILHSQTYNISDAGARSLRDNFEFIER